jgi:hypothetical protein
LSFWGTYSIGDYKSWSGKQKIASLSPLTFSEKEQYAPLPFGQTGTWVDVLDAEYNVPPYEKNTAYPEQHEEDVHIIVVITVD